MREFGFELSLCARLEADHEAVVARQLGGGVHDPGGRVLDVVLVEPGPEFDRRTAITPEQIPGLAIESDAGPGRFRPVGEAFGSLDVHPETVDAVVERAVDIGFFERRRRGGRTEIRQVTRYPDVWFDKIVGIENKPDLGSPGALERQLRLDVSLGIVDRAVLATASYVTRAHRNRIPDQVGIWRYRLEEGDLEVVREAEPLPVDEPGVELLERHPGRTDVEVVDASEKARARRRLAERAYAKGWRTYRFPECARVRSTDRHGTGGLPYCEWKDRLVNSATECGPECPGHEPADAPVVDLQGERARRSPWDPDPEGRARQQVGLFDFE